ncbi:NGG1p interacting factor NIF3 [Neptunomonas sp.]|uniref:NGG1p interacting factor NIF3 n=1 Tax=Neptunomonas sp. TaxID=1971898 RepID=UPI0035645E31
MYQLVFYVPESHREAVKTALFAQGAGRIGDYDSCCWQVQGQGQFRPMEGSQPFIGKRGQLEKIAEWKVEMVCEDHLIKAVVKTLKAVHPFEEVAYRVYRLADV